MASGRPCGIVLVLAGSGCVDISKSSCESDTHLTLVVYFDDHRWKAAFKTYKHAAGIVIAVRSKLPPALANGLLGSAGQATGALQPLPDELWAEILASLPREALPRGPVAQRIRSPTLRHINIPLWFTNHPNDILAYFQGFPGPNCITTLHPAFVEFDHMYLAGPIGIAFPNLAELHVEVLIRIWSSGTPFEAPKIRKDCLHLTYLSDYSFGTKPTLGFGCFDINELKDSLVSQHPELKVLWVDGSDTMYLWRKGRDVLQYNNDAGTAYDFDARRPYWPSTLSHVLCFHVLGGGYSDPESRTGFVCPVDFKLSIPTEVEVSHMGNIQACGTPYLDGSSCNSVFTQFSSVSVSVSRQ
ncbi:hypothetical protein C8F04DRAFT_1232896 [Mycena alexandri]|uniref:Uncharacterized protein n=1 Tax=Mycena alexandri TaxID=1745969 RepID=A0AAD6SZS6_9AGAR|nr:hypothetical protein C8F04DRAFT_1232896 [Mycena alexandri]